MDLDVCVGVGEIKESKRQQMDVDGGLDGPSSLGDSTLEVICSDGRQFTVDRQHLTLSTMCRNALTEDPTAKSLSLPGVRGDVFEHILEYLTHHKGVATRHIDQPAPSDKMVENVEDKWDAEWVDALWTKGRRLLLDVMEGSNSMDVTLLTELCACKVATRIKGIPAERVRARVHPDFTDADDEKLANGAGASSGGDGSAGGDGEDEEEDDEEDEEDDEDERQRAQEEEEEEEEEEDE